MYITPRQKKRYIFNALFIAVAIPLTVLAGYTVTQLISDASTEAVPENVALVTPTTNSITVTWTTPKEASAQIEVDKGGEISEPYRDVRGTGSRKTHFVEIIDLAPDTTYTFTIISDGRSYTSDGGRPFTFTTSPLGEDFPVPKLIYGNIPNLQSDDALVYAFTTSAPQSLPAGSVPNSNGNWIVDISGLKSLDKTTTVSVSDDTQIKIVVIGPNGTGAISTGSYSELFDEDGKLNDTVDLKLVENPNIINELPSESMVGSITAGPQVTASCGGSCATVQCAEGLSCIEGTCRNASCPTQSSCECDEAPGLCNDDCTSDTDCTDDLVCFAGSCRNNDCTEDEECLCESNFDPDDREFRLVLDIPWVDMYPNGVTDQDELDEKDDEPSVDPEIVTGMESLRIVNQNDNTFGLIWLSENPSTGFVRYGTSADALDQEVNDVRDGLLERDTYHSHLVQVFDLQPETTYFYEIVSGTDTYNDNGDPFSFTTFETLSGPPPFGTVQGRVQNVDDPDDVIVVLQLNDVDGEGSPGDSNLVAVALDSNQTWLANIEDARTQDGSQYFTYTEDDQLTAGLYVYAEIVPEIIPVSQFEDDIELEVFLYDQLPSKTGRIALLPFMVAKFSY